MTAQQLWKEGRLDEAVEAQIAEVRTHPGDADRRYFLFALLCLAGELDRAARQLDALGVGDPKLQGTAVVYRNLLGSEADRRRVWAGEAKPVLPPEAPGSLAGRVDAIATLGAGRAEDAAALLAKAAEAEAGCAGACDGHAFTDVTDTDELLGPNLEVFAGGRFLLVPFALLRSVSIAEPKHLLDLVWIPASLAMADGTDADVHLPVLYEGTHAATNSPVRLGRGTEWYDAGGPVRGRGQKVLAFGGDGDGDAERALLSIRALTFAGTGAAERG